jgi:hypothetical protein
VDAPEMVRPLAWGASRTRHIKDINHDAQDITRPVSEEKHSNPSKAANVQNVRDGQNNYVPILEYHASGPSGVSETK